MLDAFDGAAFVAFRGKDIYSLATEYARAGRVDGLRVLFKQHSAALLPRRLEVRASTGGGDKIRCVCVLWVGEWIRWGDSPPAVVCVLCACCVRVVYTRTIKPMDARDTVCAVSNVVYPPHRSLI